MMMMTMAKTSTSMTSMTSSKTFEKKTNNITSARQRSATPFASEKKRGATRCSSGTESSSSSSSSSLVFDGTSMFTIYSGAFYILFLYLCFSARVPLRARRAVVVCFKSLKRSG